LREALEPAGEPRGGSEELDRFICEEDHQLLTGSL
jgi:hypothetical protein